MPSPLDPFDIMFGRSMFSNEEIMEDMFAARPGASIRHHFSSYSYQEDKDKVQIAVDLPGISVKDLKLEVVSGTSCVVDLQAQPRKLRNSEEQTATTFRERFLLGSQVDCDQLSANLSRGVLQLTAPKKEPEKISGRSISITEREE
jgi:HSP20 family protein